MKFKQFMAMPVVRQAFQITPRHRITQNNYDGSRYHISDLDNIDDGVGEFVSYEPPVVGGWVIQSPEIAPYYCTDATFHKNFLVP